MLYFSSNCIVALKGPFSYWKNALKWEQLNKVRILNDTTLKAISFSKKMLNDPSSTFHIMEAETISPQV